MEIFEFSFDEAVVIMEMASRAQAFELPLRIARNGNGMSFKVGGGMWTAPMGEKE